MKFCIFFSFACLLVAGCLLSAQTPGTKLTQLRTLTQAQIDPARLLPPPASDGTPAQAKEMQAVKQLIQTRTSERYTQAKWDASHEDPTPFTAVIDPHLDLAKMPATRTLLADVLNDQTIATSAAKDFFKRKFPVAAANPGESFPDWTCDATDRTPASRPLRSYPSGHATMAYTFATVLGALVPNKAQGLLARASDYAYSRQVCGDHYQSDVEAGHVLGTALGIMFLNSPRLKPDLDAARAELHTAGYIN